MSGDERFISPEADAYEAREAAQRLGTLDGQKIGMVDSMLNPSALWGQGILDGVEHSVRERNPEASFEREDRSPFAGVLGPDQWAEAMKAKYAALVIAVGD